MFKDVFSNELPAEPAKIEPFNLVVETEKWRVLSNTVETGWMAIAYGVRH